MRGAVRAGVKAAPRFCFISVSVALCSFSCLFISRRISCWAERWAGWRWRWLCRRASSQPRLRTAAGGDPGRQTKTKTFKRLKTFTGFSQHTSNLCRNSHLYAIFWHLMKFWMILVFIAWNGSQFVHMLYEIWPHFTEDASKLAKLWSFSLHPSCREKHHQIVPDFCLRIFLEIWL